MAGLMIPAKGFLPPGHQWFGHPTFDVNYDPAAGQEAAGRGGLQPGQAAPQPRSLISASGSGQMQPLPMNEFVQQNLAEVGIKVDFEVVEWNTLINIWRAGAKPDSARGGTGHQLHLLHPGPVHGLHPARPVRPRRAERHQLGLLLRPRDGQAARPGAQRLRSGRADAGCCRRSTRNTSTMRCS